MGEQTITLLEKTDELFTKKIPFQAYVIASVFLTFLVGVSVYDYYVQESEVSPFLVDNYETVQTPNWFLYLTGQIPNSKELPKTKADIVIATSNDGNKEMIQSPFGYVYERNK